jgi:hypothetical protein
VKQLKRMAAGAVAAAALGSAVFGIGAGVAQAKPGGHGHDDFWVPGGPPGHGPLGPPGHDPWGPPGHGLAGPPGPPPWAGPPPNLWRDPVHFGLPPVWRPGNWLDLGIRDPQPLIWDPGRNSWGIWWNGFFIGYGG